MINFAIRKLYRRKSGSGSVSTSVTIPAEMVKEMGLDKDSEVFIEVADKTIVLRRVSDVNLEKK